MLSADIFSMLLAMGVGTFANYYLGDKRIGDSNLTWGRVPGGLSVAGGLLASDIRHNLRAKKLYNKTPEDLIKWNLDIDNE